MPDISYKLRVLNEFAQPDIKGNGKYFNLLISGDQRVIGEKLPFWLPEETLIPGCICGSTGGETPIDTTYSIQYQNDMYLVALPDKKPIMLHLEEIRLDLSLSRVVRPGEYEERINYSTLEEQIDPNRDDMGTSVIYNEEKAPVLLSMGQVTPLRIVGMQRF